MCPLAISLTHVIKSSTGAELGGYPPRTWSGLQDYRSGSTIGSRGKRIAPAFSGRSGHTMRTLQTLQPPNRNLVQSGHIASGQQEEHVSRPEQPVPTLSLPWIVLYCGGNMNDHKTVHATCKELGMAYRREECFGEW
ncbi:unnamed protein product [Choristocarpus tenellus]